MVRCWLPISAAQAVDKNGKPLAGAAKSSFMKKCQREACEAQAIDKNGKPLAGAAKLLREEVSGHAVSGVPHRLPGEGV